jgi:hypothetical protein
MACFIPLWSSTHGLPPRLCRLCSRPLIFPPLGRSNLCDLCPLTRLKVRFKTNRPCRLRRAIPMLVALRASRLLPPAMHPLHGTLSRLRAHSPVTEARPRCPATTRLSLPRLPTAIIPRLHKAPTVWACQVSAQLSSLLVHLLPVAWQAPQSCRLFAD